MIRTASVRDKGADRSAVMVMKKKRKNRWDITDPDSVEQFGVDSDQRRFSPFM